MNVIVYDKTNHDHYLFIFTATKNVNLIDLLQGKSTSKEPMNLRYLSTCLLFILFSSITAFAAEPKLTFYLPFEGSIDASIAGGSSKGIFGIKDQPPEFADGISGKGFLTGGSNEEVHFSAKGNISPDQWTISFWVKELPGAKWNSGKL